MKTTKKNYTFRLVTTIIISLVLSTNAYCGHKQPKNLDKYLLKLEGKLIERTQKAEEILYNSGAIYDDKEVFEYINVVAQKIIPNDFNDEKIDIKFKVIRDPTVNAFALPNGTIYVHAGLLSRLENEAQLAFVMGHEISHVVNKDGVYATQSLHNKTVSTKLFDLLLAPAAVFFGLLGDLVRTGFGLLYVSSVTGYGREQEARADRESIKFATLAGYDVKEAPKIIEILMKEHDKYEGKEEIYFLMNHPSNKWRRKKMEQLIEEEYHDAACGTIEKEIFFDKMADVKLYNTSLNIKIDRLEHAMDNIQSILKISPENAEAHFYAGEIYRAKAEDREKLKYELSAQEWGRINKNVDKARQIDEWRKTALAEYEYALNEKPDYYEAYRGLGILYYDMNRREEALQNLNKYLKLNEKAKDRRYVSSLIKRIEAEKLKTEQ